MAAVKKHPGKRSIRLADAIPALLASALEKQDDLIVTCEINPDTGRKTLHVMTGKLISGCMLNKQKNPDRDIPGRRGDDTVGKMEVRPGLSGEMTCCSPRGR